MTDVFQLTTTFARDVLNMEGPDRPTRLTPERKEWFRRALQEELDEFVEADNLADEVDAVIDLIYFAAGRLFEMGLDGGAHFREVHACNVLKKKGRLEKRSHGLGDAAGIDATKPEDWTPPDHERLIAERASAPRRSKPKVLILGHARHGKDTVAEMLRDQHGYTFSSSSHFCAERVMLPYFNAQPGVGYADVNDCYADRVNHRATWFDQIKAYNTPDRSRLAREMLEENDLYVGMRSSDEFEAARSLFDYVVWVDASGRGVAPEPRDSFDIDFHPSMWLVRNDGTLEDLEAAVKRLAIIIQGDK